MLGFDINIERIDEHRSGNDSTLEVTPEELRSSTRLENSSDREQLKRRGICIVTVPTPINGANRPNLTSLIKAMRDRRCGVNA